MDIARELLARPNWRYRGLLLRSEWRRRAPEAVADIYVWQQEARDTRLREHTAFRLRIEADRVEPGLRAPAVAAAQKVFADAGITPMLGFDGHCANETWDEVYSCSAGTRPADDLMQAAAVWYRAQDAAGHVCFPDQPDASLQLSVDYRD